MKQQVVFVEQSKLKKKIVKSQSKVWEWKERHENRLKHADCTSKKNQQKVLSRKFLSATLPHSSYLKRRMRLIGDWAYRKITFNRGGSPVFRIFLLLRIQQLGNDVRRWLWRADSLMDNKRSSGQTYVQLRHTQVTSNFRYPVNCKFHHY